MFSLEMKKLYSPPKLRVLRIEAGELTSEQVLWIEEEKAKMPNYRQHQNASRVPPGSEARVIQFRSLEEKARWLDAAASLDAERGGVQHFAKRFLGVRDPELRTRAIHRWVRDHIHYEADFRVTQGQPGEEFADSETILRRLYGDCDDKSRLFVCLLYTSPSPRDRG